MYPDAEFELLLWSVSDREAFDFGEQVQGHAGNFGGVLIVVVDR